MTLGPRKNGSRQPRHGTKMMALAAVLMLHLSQPVSTANRPDDDTLIKEAITSLDMKNASCVVFVGENNAGINELKKLLRHDETLTVEKVKNKFKLDAHEEMTFVPSVSVDLESRSKLFTMTDAEPEMPAQLFNKRVFESAGGLKLVIVESFSDLLADNYFETLTKAMKNVIQVLGNKVEWYSNSLCFVATKIDRKKQNDTELIGELEYKVGEFVKYAKKLKEEAMEANDHETVAELNDQIAISNYLLRRNRFGILRTPNAKKSPWDLPPIKKNYNQLRKLIFDKMEFSLRIGSAAEVVVSPETQQLVENEYLPEAESQMNDTLWGFAESLEKALYGKLFNKFDAFWADFFTAAFNRLTTFAHLESLVNLLEVPSKSGEDVGSVAYRIKFYYEVIGKSFDEYEAREIAGCEAEFQRIFRQASKNHAFLDSLQREHDTSQVQVHLVQDQSALVDGLSVENFQTWQKNLTNLGFSENTTQIKTKGNDVMVQKINSLARSVPLNEALNSTEGLFLYSGHYVFLSQAVSIFPENTTHEIEIVALRKLFVDCDLELWDTHLTIWAPVMEITGSKKMFVFKGSDAPPAPTETPGIKGYDGFSSGKFNLFVQEVDNAGMLLVEIQGGDGSDGIVGKNGIDVDLDGYFDPNADFNGFKGDVTDHSNFINTVLDPKYHSTYHEHGCNMFGKNCDYDVTVEKNFKLEPNSGEKGGNGGAGAFPGDFLNSQRFLLTTRNGTHGRPASGGQGGTILRIARHYDCENTVWNSKDKCWKDYYPPYYYVKGSPGEIGDSPPSPVTNYKHTKQLTPFDSYLRLNLLAVFSPAPIRPDYKFLSFNSTEIAEELTTKNFFQFLGTVQDAFVNTTYTANLKIVVSSFYDLFTIYKDLGKETDSSYLDLIELMFVDTLSKCDSLSTGRQVVRLADKITNEIRRLDELEDIRQDLFVYEVLQKEGEDAAKEIAEAEVALQEFYDEEMVEIKEQIDSQLDQLVENIYKEQIEYAQNIAELQQQKKKYQRAMRRKKICGIFGYSLKIAGFFYPPAGIAGSVMLRLGNAGSGGAGSIEELLPDITNAADNAAAVVAEYWLSREMDERSKQEAQLEAIQLFLNDTELETQVLTQEEQESARLVVEEASNLEEVDDEEWNVFYETFDSVEGKIVAARTNAESENDQVKLTVYKTVFGAAKEGFLLAKDVGNFVREIKSTNANLEMFDAAIDANKLAIEQLEAYERMIDTLFMPMLQDMADRLDNMQTELSDANSVLTDIKAFEMKRKIREFAEFCTRFTAGLLEEDGFAELSAQLQDVVSVLADGYDKIEEIGFRLEMKQFMGGLVAGECNQATDPETCNAYLMARSEVEKSHLLVAFVEIFAAYRQVTFPFGFDKVKILGKLVEKLRDNGLESDGAIREVQASLNSVKTELDDMSTSITNQDKDIIYAIFNPKFRTGKAFYTWPAGNEHLAQVEKLLRGKEVSLMAPVSPQEERNAIKFKLASLNLTSTDPKVNARVQDLLLSFRLETTHVGPSYYKCGTSNFVIGGDPLHFSVTYERDEFGNPIEINEALSKLKNGDVPLSPFTAWRFKLEYAASDDEEEAVRDELLMMAGLLDLQLIGEGYYVKEKAEICNELSNAYVDLEQQF